MFLELSFDSTAGDPRVSASKAASSQRYSRELEQDESLDALISDFHSALRSNRSNSVSSSEASPPRLSKAKESTQKSWDFGNRASAGNRRTATAKKRRDDESEAESEAVTPMPRLAPVPKPKSSLLKAPNRQLPTRTLKPAAAPQRRKFEQKSPVLASPSLSPVTSSSAASSPSSISEDIYMSLTPDEDSIDALIGKDIRNLNHLISSGSRGNRLVGGKPSRTSSARSPTTDEIADELRQSTRFRKHEADTSSRGGNRGKNTRSRLSPGPHSSPFRLNMPGKKSKQRMLASPPPPPPPDEDEDEDEQEDSFAEEIRRLRESRRVVLMPSKSDEKQPTKEEIPCESSEICAAAALKIRNASNAIDALLLEAMKPFEDRQRDHEKAEAVQEKNAGGDAAIRNAATAALPSATQTIVSQLELTFAEMTERRQADLKAEADAAAAVKETEKKEKEAAEEKKKADEKEAKEREMEILRLVPMHGKLLTSSADIEKVLGQLEGVEAPVKNQRAVGPSVMETELETLRSQTQRKIQEIEARMATPSATSQPACHEDGVSWRRIDWMRENLTTDGPIAPHQGGSPSQETGSVSDPSSVEDEGPFQEVLQRHVMEKLDLAILKLKHVLAIDSKEATEALEKQKQDEEKKQKELAQKELEDQRKQREQEGAEAARRRVMGWTSVDQVEGWMEEERQLQHEFGHARSLQRLMSSLNTRMDAESRGNRDIAVTSSSTLSGAASHDHSEVLRQFHRLSGAMVSQQRLKGEGPKEGDEGDHEHGITHRRLQKQDAGRLERRHRKHQWLALSSNSSDSEGDDGSDLVDSDGGVSPRR
ncbi:hypothetical protein BBJ28_00011900 [Nothophytophthora sp. Chile5]|nr:hypothetical protein BBJ28_00011900 [Nothophytophthora sp. Chile5]